MAKKLINWEQRDRKRANQERREHSRGNFYGDERSHNLIHRNSVYCPSAGKHKMLFNSEGAARKFIEFNADEIEATYGSAPRYVYYCDVCMGWHTSSYNLPNGYQSKNRRMIGNVMKKKKGAIKYCKRILWLLDECIGSVESGVCSEVVCNYKLVKYDDVLYNGFKKRRNKVLNYFSDGKPEGQKEELLTSVKKFKKHVKNHMLSKYYVIKD